MEEKSLIVGTCKVCGRPIDNAKEGYITDSKGNLYHVECYGGQ